MIELDRNADTFPVGLAGTPFEEVYRALRIVTATVWSVDPSVYRAGMAWGWYALYDPATLVGFRDVVTAALISAMAPMVKETQTDAELVEYLRQWRSYTPTFPKLQALYALFGAVVDIQPISDPESQAVLPVDDTRLAFYIRIESIDFSRPLSLSEAREIAVRATPLGSQPYPYYALETHIPCAVSPAPVGIYIRLGNWETARPPAPPQQLGELIFVDADTGAVVHSVESLNELVFTATGYFTIEDGSDVVFVQPSQYPVVSPLSHNFDPNVSVADGVTLATDIPYYPTKLYIPVVVWHDESWNFYTDYIGWDIDGTSGSIVVTNNTGATRIVLSVIAVLIDATDAEVVDVKNQLDEHFRAFKWMSGGTDYYYVEDGNEAWTDDLEAEGYEEVPVVVLPTVNTDAGWVTIYPNHADFPPNEVREGRVWGSSSSWEISTYDSTKTYAAIWWHDDSNRSGYYGVDISNYNGHIGLTNVLQFTIVSYIESRYATCDSTQVSVVTAFDSNNIAYNAFKFTVQGADYYYVLDDAQTDWTDDLSSIGYSLTPNISGTYMLAMSLDSNNTPTAVTFNAGSYWWSRIPDSVTKQVFIDNNMYYDSGYAFGSAKYSTSGKMLVLTGVYTDAAGTSICPGWQWTFEIRSYSGDNVAGVYSRAAYSTAVAVYRVRIVAS